MLRGRKAHENLLSEWMHRLWTMEEASFGASKLSFQFREGTFRLPDFEARRDYTQSFNLGNHSPQRLVRYWRCFHPPPSVSKQIQTESGGSRTIQSLRQVRRS